MSGSTSVDPHAFYTERIPAEFNHVLEAQAAQGDAGREVYDGMVAVDATIRVEVRGEEDAIFFLNIESGRMSPADAPNRVPFLTLIQDRKAFQRLEREAGSSMMALLGGVFGIAGRMKLTKRRIIELEALKGLVRFEVTGDDGFAVLTHFGPHPVPDEPHATIRLGEDAYQELRSGRLDLEDAFFSDRIHVEGDMQLATQLALAAMTPD